MAEKAGSAQCAACHDQLAKAFHRTTHAQQDVQCEDCHGAGGQHAASGGDKTKIVRLAAEPAQKANSTCLGCHKENEQLQNWASGAHQRNHVRCLECHKVHAVEANLASRREQNERCVGCHRKQDAEGRLPYHHPVREAKMSCADCHDPHGGTAANNLRASNLNELCFQCHAEYQGPFTFQHAPVTENCGMCHSPHGSANRNLLLVSQPVLCLQCHSGHHNGTGNPLLNRCTNCHSAIHGTDTPSATGGSVFIDK